MAGELLARLPTLARRDQKEATFVLNMTADWPTLDEEGKTVIYQRLYLYASFVAPYGWPTAIAAMTPCRYLRASPQSSKEHDEDDNKYSSSASSNRPDNPIRCSHRSSSKDNLNGDGDGSAGTKAFF